MKSLIYQSQSEGITRALGRKLSSQLKHGGTILLHGELGGGKTTFAQGVAEGVGIHHPITSPTFTILNNYPTSHPVITELVHVDLYRVQSEDQVRTIDLPHFLKHPTTLVLLEWPERLDWDWATAAHLLGEIHFVTEEMHHRTITLEGDIAELL